MAVTIPHGDRELQQPRAQLPAPICLRYVTPETRLRARPTSPPLLEVPLEVTSITPPDRCSLMGSGHHPGVSSPVSASRVGKDSQRSPNTGTGQTCGKQEDGQGSFAARNMPGLCQKRWKQMVCSSPLKDGTYWTPCSRHTVTFRRTSGEPTPTAPNF